MSKLAEYLNRHIIGNVFDRQSVRESYSTDRSILKITPRLVALPENTNDVRKLLRFASQLASRDFRLPITARGTGLDKTGASIGTGLILSTEKLNRIEEIDIRGRLVRVQPGITLGELNAALRLQGLWLPIEYDHRSTLGGLIANCPQDDLAHRYGGITQCLDRAEVVLANGDLVQFGPMSSHVVEAKMANPSVDGALYKKIDHLLDERADLILDRAMRPFDAAGYAYISQVRMAHAFNPLPLLFASQGTLGIVSDLILHVEPIPLEPQHLLVSFHDLKAAQRFLNFACSLDPYMLKVYDLRIIEEASEHGKKPDLFTRKLGKGLLVIISFNYHRYKNRKKLDQCLSALPNGTFSVLETPMNSEAFRTLENSLFSYLNDEPHGEHAPVLDDVFVPGIHFGDYLDGLKKLEKELRLDLPVFGSFATSNYTVRPNIDCTTMDGRKQIIEFLKAYSRLIDSCHGSLTANSPEGRVKSLLTGRQMSVGERQLYTDIKQIFDPQNILNPQVKLGADIKTTIRYLRTQEKGGIITP